MRVPQSQINTMARFNALKLAEEHAAKKTETHKPKETASTTEARKTATPANAYSPAKLAVDPGEAASISGKTLLLSRVFRCLDPKIEPAVVNEFNETTRKTPQAQFLTATDRNLLGDIYEYAQKQNVDLGYVDQLAGVLGQFRKSNNGEQMSMVDIAVVPGQTRKYDYADTDKAIIERIMSSEAFKTTQLDPDFIRHAADSKYAHIRHTDFNFLEAVVNKFSTEGEKASPLGDRFSRYSGPRDYHAPAPIVTAEQPTKPKVDPNLYSDPTRKWGAKASFSQPTMEHIFRTLNKVFGRNAHPGLFDFLADRVKRD
ncbi:hypothetical protein ACCD10_31310 [Pseudomonas sp. Pseusp122]|uniref:hypothetical protein n=1 Tax=unclassified Pseudomonas TaxID=196821 RepID=UPI0039A4651B